VSRHFIEEKIRTTAGQSGISGSDIKSMPVPLCNTEEQDMIQNCIEAELSNTSQMLFDIDENICRSESLRQSILKKAFFGQLVEQDPNDEPASVLLERIEAEKAKQAKPAKKKKRKTAA
jgi:type I restriction enzyme S subunit